MHVVVVRDGQPGEKPERRRRHYMERLLYELDSLDIDSVTFESRGPKDDKRDEPTLWIADAVCGTVVQFRTGDVTYLEAIRAQAELRMLSI